MKKVILLILATFVADTIGQSCVEKRTNCIADGHGYNKCWRAFNRCID